MRFNIFDSDRLAERRQLVNRLQEAASDVSEKHSEYEDAVNSLNSAIEDYNNVLNDVGSFRDDVIHDIDNALNKLNDFRNTWESLGSSDLSTIDSESEPDIDGFDDELANAPTSPDDE